MSSDVGLNNLPVNTDNVGNIENVGTEKCLGRMVHDTVLMAIAHLDRKVSHETESYKKRHQRVIFLHDMQTAINLATETNGGIDFNKHEDLKKIRLEARKMHKEGEKLLNRAAELEAISEDAHNAVLAKSLRDEAAELRSAIKAMDALSDKQVYTKEEKDRLVENIRTTCDNFNTMNQLQSQTINRLNNEFHQVMLGANNVLKKDDEMNKKFFQGIAGR